MHIVMNAMHVDVFYSGSRTLQDCVVHFVSSSMHVEWMKYLIDWKHNLTMHFVIYTRHIDEVLIKAEEDLQDKD